MHEDKPFSQVEGSALPFDLFTTEGLKPKDGLDAARETLRQVHDLHVPEESGQDFQMTLRAFLPGPFAFFSGFGTERILVRDQRKLRQHQADSYRLMIPLKSTMVRFHSDGQYQSISSGQVAFSDLTRVHEMHGSSGAFAQIVIGRDRLDALLPNARRLHGFVPRGPLAQLVADHLRAFERELPSLTVADAARVAEATLQMVGAMAASGPLDDAGRPAIELAMRRRILRHINEHLLDPTLNSERLCRDFGLSRASLYRLFEPFDGVAAVIRERRLRAIRRELCEPGPHHLGQLSYKYGYSSQSQMTRVFRTLFGHAPKDTPCAPQHKAILDLPDDAGMVSWSRILRQVEE